MLSLVKETGKGLGAVRQTFEFTGLTPGKLQESSILSSPCANPVRWNLAYIKLKTAKQHHSSLSTDAVGADNQILGYGEGRPKALTFYQKTKKDDLGTRVWGKIIGRN